MTSWSERQETADREWRIERATAEQAACPRCQQPPGKTCQNVATGESLRKAPLSEPAT